jgi:hypothetical protein
MNSNQSPRVIDADNRIDTKLSGLPDPDYRNHQAYGGFRYPSLSLRLRASARFSAWFLFVFAKRILLFDRLPSMPEYEGPIAGDLGARLRVLRQYLPPLARTLANNLFRRSSAATLSTKDASTHYESLRANGIVPIRLPQEAMATISRQVEEPLSDLLRRREKAGQRSFEGNQLWLNPRASEPLYRTISETLQRNGILDAASAYLGHKVSVKYLLLQVNENDDQYQYNKFADVGAPDPATNYMHIDTSEETLKCMFYLDKIDERNGPFGYVLGSNNLKVGWFEGLVRRANDRAGFSGYSRETRAEFMALPGRLRRKCTFGSDLLDSDSRTQMLADAEYRFVSRDGDVALFDNLGIHRGALVSKGQRRVLIATLS